MMKEFVDRELLHFAYGFFLMECLWCFNFFMKRMSEKKKLPKLLARYRSPRSYHGLYVMAGMSILVGVLLHELWDLTWQNNPPVKSWVDIGFWLLGILTAWFWAYRKWFYITRWNNG